MAARSRKPIRLGGCSVGWLAHEVDEWLHRQIDASRSTLK